MSRMRSILVILSLIESINSQQAYIPDQNYYEFSSPYSGTGLKAIKVAYPIKICSGIGNTITSAPLSRYECSAAGGYIRGPCSSDETYCLTLACVGGTPTHSSGTGQELCPNDGNTVSTNYVEISFYCGYNMNDTHIPTDCPNNDNPSTGFTPSGFASLATNQCIDQGNGEYFMATCNNVSAAIEIHADAGCSNQIGSHAIYTRSCEKYANPQGNGKCVYYRRVTKCMVNGADILVATQEPTKNPTLTPTKTPTGNPTIQPTSVPTSVPSMTTIHPSVTPTNIPTNIPTVEPTSDPTEIPTRNPTTYYPTNGPIEATKEDLDPEETILGAEQILSGLNNISLIYIVCGILFTFYLFICFYIWFNEKKKRNALKSNFQSEDDKDARKEYLRKRNIQRKLELQGMSAKQAQKAAQQMIANGNYQNMKHNVNNNNNNNNNNNRAPPIDNQLMYEGR